MLLDGQQRPKSIDYRSHFGYVRTHYGNELDSCAQ